MNFHVFFLLGQQNMSMVSLSKRTPQNAPTKKPSDKANNLDLLNILQNLHALGNSGDR
jgi:hypothetical protein